MTTSVVYLVLDTQGLPVAVIVALVALEQFCNFRVVLNCFLVASLLSCQELFMVSFRLPPFGPKKGLWALET